MWYHSLYTKAFIFKQIDTNKPRPRGEVIFNGNKTEKIPQVIPLSETTIRLNLDIKSYYLLRTGIYLMLQTDV